MQTVLERQNSKFAVFIYAVSLFYAAFENFLQQFGFFDEIVAFTIFAYALIFSKIKRKKEFISFVIIILFYVTYSIFIQSNINKAIFRDLISILKPFLCFYSFYYLSFKLTKNQCQILSRLSLIFGVILWFILPFINNLYANTAAYYPSCILCAVAYILFSNNKNKWTVALLLILPGLFTNRSKFYTELILFIYIAYFFKNQFKISLRHIIVAIILILLAIFLNWNKFSIYFITGAENGVARTLLYVNSISILNDYFPFGSGLGSFATDASGKYYSDLYFDYDLNYTFGLSPNDYKTDHDYFSDTFYPALIAQYGILGIILFFYFWYKRYIAVRYNYDALKLFIFSMLFICIESIAAPTFVSKTAIPIMFTLALIAKQKKYVKYNETVCISNSASI